MQLLRIVTVAASGLVRLLTRIAKRVSRPGAGPKVCGV